MGSDDDTTENENSVLRAFIEKNSTEFTYLNPEEEDIAPFDNLAWFDGRPIYYWIEAFVIVVSNQYSLYYIGFG